MTKFIVAAILAVLAVTYHASPAKACGGQGVAVVERARLAVNRVVCRVAEPFKPRAVYVVPAFVAPVPKSIPTPMPKAKSSTELEAEVAELKRRQQAAGRALLFGDAPPAATAKTKTASECPGGVCPATPVRRLLFRR